MSTDPRPGMIRFNGLPTVWWMAICQTCDTAMPFTSEVLRNAWMAEHVQTRNCVITTAVDLVPDPAATAEKKKALINRLRQKYSKPLDHGVACASAKCRQMIVRGQRAANRGGLWWHASCLPDEEYIAMASASDIAPMLSEQPRYDPIRHAFEAANPSLRQPPTPGDSVQIRVIGGGGAGAGRAGIRAGGGGGGGGGTVRTVTVPRSSLISFDTDPAGKLGHTLKLAEDTIAALFAPGEVTFSRSAPDKPRKPNARDRRRAKRAGKQWK